jgi:hypothetical protein
VSDRVYSVINESTGLFDYLQARRQRQAVMMQHTTQLERKR